MKKRIVSGFIAAILLIIAVFSGEIILNIAVFAASVIGLYEFYTSISKKGYRPIKLLGFIFSLLLLLLSLFPFIFKTKNMFHEIENFQYTFSAFNFLLFLVIFSLFATIIFKNNIYTLEDIAITLLGILYIPFLFFFVILLRNMENGLYYVWLAFLGAWGTDIFAFFTGHALGKKKIIPRISPAKTVAGFIGGILGSSVLIAVFGLFYINRFLSAPVPLLYYVVLGLITGTVSQLGDWAASAVKRNSGIKDYGNIIPGHGGILDRCDSLLFVAPVVYFYIKFVL